VARVAERVRQRLLDDAVDGHVEGRRYRDRLAIDLEGGWQPGLSHAFDQAAQRPDPGLRRETARLVLGKRAQEPAQLCHRLAPRSLDGEQG